MNEPYCFVSILFYVPPHVHVQHAVEKTKEGKVALRLSWTQKSVLGLLLYIATTTQYSTLSSVCFCVSNSELNKTGTSRLPSV